VIHVCVRARGATLLVFFRAGFLQEGERPQEQDALYVIENRTPFALHFHQQCGKDSKCSPLFPLADVVVPKSCTSLGWDDPMGERSVMVAIASQYLDSHGFSLDAVAEYEDVPLLVPHLARRAHMSPCLVKDLSKPVPTSVKPKDMGKVMLEVFKKELSNDMPQIHTHTFVIEVRARGPTRRLTVSLATDEEGFRTKHVRTASKISANIAKLKASILKRPRKKRVHGNAGQVKKLMDTHLSQSKWSLRLAGVGVSLIDHEIDLKGVEKPVELAYVYLGGVDVKLLNEGREETVQARVQKLQVDNQLQECLFRVLLVTKPEEKGDEVGEVDEDEVRPSSRESWVWTRHLRGRWRTQRTACKM
jgi:hypothetical protein